MIHTMFKKNKIRKHKSYFGKGWVFSCDLNEIVDVAVLIMRGSWFHIDGAALEKQFLP